MMRKEGPLITILATEASPGMSFPFVPSQLRLMCCDCDRFPVSRAVTTWSALPGPFAPIVLRDYAGQCSYEAPEWVRKAIENRDPLSRVYWMTSAIDQMSDARTKRYAYLIDGVGSDNLGLRSVIDSVAGRGGDEKLFDTISIAGRKKGLHLSLSMRRLASCRIPVTGLCWAPVQPGSWGTMMKSPSRLQEGTFTSIKSRYWRIGERAAGGRAVVELWGLHR